MRARRIKFFFALLLLVVFVVCYRQLSTRARPRVAPDFTLPALQAEQKITLQHYRGQAVVLNFFATWCHNCRREKKILQTLRREYRELPVISILTFDAEADLSELQEQTVALDRDGAVARRYGVRWLPQTFLIDAEGRIVQHFSQPLDATRYAVLTERVAMADKKSGR